MQDIWSVGCQLIVGLPQAAEERFTTVQGWLHVEESHDFTVVRVE